MSGLSQDSYAIAGVPLSGLGGGGSGAVQSTFSTIYVSETGFITSLAAASVSTMILEADEATISSLSSFFIYGQDIACSSISTLGIILDGNILTSASNELLLNGIPIATNSSLSTIADWAIDPAISTVQMNNHPIIGSIGYLGTGTVSTTDIQAATGTIGNLVCSDISTVTLTVLSTIHSISSISSLVVATDALFVSSINGGSYPPLAGPTVSTFNTASVSSLTVSSINGAVPGSVANWSQSPAISDVNISTHALNFKPFTGTGGIVTGYTNSQFDTNITMGSNSTIILPQVNAFVSQFNVGGLTNPAGSMTVITSGSIGLNSVAGVNILGVGGCSVTGVGGVSIAGGGGLSILGGGAVLVDGGNVTVNGAGLVSIEALGGLAVGAGGVAVTGGVVAITGASGVLMTGGGGISIAGGGGVVVAAGGTVLSPAATISSLNVSSVNGVAYPPTTAVPADLVVSTLNAAQTITTSSIGTNTLTANDLYATRLTINGTLQNPGIVLQGNGSAPSYSSEIYFSQGIPGNSTIGLFMTSITPSSQAITTQYHSTAFSAGGGVGNFAVDKLFLSQNGTTWANLQADPAASSIKASVGISVSSLTDVSTINGVAYPPASSGGIQSTIANAGSFVNIDGTGTISISTSLIPAGTHNLNVDVDNNITLQVENGGIYLDNNNAVSHVHLTGNGDVDIFAAGNNSINLDYNGGITITAAVPGTVNIINLSTINGAPYPPVAPAVSTITNGGGFINIDAAGAISTATAAAVGYSVVSNNAMTFNATQNGILLQDTDFGASLRVYNGITIGAGTSSFVIGSAVTSVSSLVDVSSINGALYPPPGVTTPSTIVNGSAFIDINGGGDILASTNGTYINIASSGILDIYSPGSDISIGTGSTIFIMSSGPPSIPAKGLYYNQNGLSSELYINGLPLIPPPSAYYSTTIATQPIFSTFSTLISMNIVQKYTSTYTVVATVNWLNDGVTAVGDNLEFSIGESGVGLPGNVVQTVTSLLPNGYQNTTITYTGFNNVFGPITLSARKPQVLNQYTVQNVVLNVLTDLYD